MGFVEVVVVEASTDEVVVPDVPVPDPAVDANVVEVVDPAPPEAGGRA
jgi:hypothetical protein